MAAHTDIIADGWVARLPRGWRPYALLARLDRPIGAWLLFLPGLWGILLGRPSAGRGDPADRAVRRRRGGDARPPAAW